jgi:predicted PurR-regulated permease PerM
MNIGKWIGLISLILSIYILWQIRQLVLILFTAVILANALNILVKAILYWNDKLTKKFGFKLKLKRGGAVALAILISLLVFILFFWLIVPPFVGQSQQLTVKVNQGIEQINIWVNIWILNVEKELSIDIGTFLPNVDELVKQMPPFVNDVLGKGWTFFSNSLLVVLNILLVVILTIMLLSNPEPYRRGFIRVFPSFYRRRIDYILVLCDEGLQGWLFGVTFNMIFIGVFSFIGLLIIGIPLALAQALLAGIFNLIPNIGPTISVIPPIIIALLDDPWKALYVLIFYIIIQQLESSILTPLVMAKQVSLLPVVTLFAQIFFATFFGIFGLVLALPLTVIGQILFKEIIVKDILDQWKLPVISTDNITVEIRDDLNSDPEIEKNSDSVVPSHSNNISVNDTNSNPREEKVVSNVDLPSNIKPIDDAFPLTNFESNLEEIKDISQGENIINKPVNDENT